MSHSDRPFGGSPVAALALALVWGASSAAGAADAPESAAGGGLEEITVTAQRYSGSLQTTPISITAFTAETLELHQITNVLEAAANIPGIVMTPTTGATSGARIFMRGVGDENTGILFDPAVGVYIDNVYQPRINGQFFDFFDVDRLEVLRGPQGTLYGRNTSGGAIKLVTRSPSLTSYTAAGDIAYGNYESLDARVYFSGPIVGNELAGSISAVSRKRDGWTYDPNYNNPVNNRNQGGLRGKLLFQPSDRFSAEFSYMFLKDNSDAGTGSMTQLLGAPVPNFDPLAVPGRNLFTSELSGPEYNHGTVNGSTLNMTYNLTPNVSINSITGWGLEVVTLLTSYLETATGLNSGTSYHFNDRYWSEELNATAKLERFKGVGGVYYFTETGHQADIPPYTAVLSLDERDRTTDAYAVFAEGTYDVIEHVGVTAGVRYTSEKAGFTQFYYNRKNLTPAPQNASQTFTATTPKFGIDWQALPNLLAYASYTKGFKSGGWNAVSPATNIGGPPGTVAGPTVYGPENVASYEAGVKFNTPDKRLRVNVNYFIAKYSGLQLPVFFPGTTNSYTYNAASAEVRGIELEPTWQATDALQIYAMGSFDTDKYTSPFNCSLYNTTIVNCEANKLKGVIPTKTTLGAEFSPKLAIKGSVHVSGEWDHNSRYFNNVSNTLPAVATPAEDLFNAALWWDSEDGHWRVTLEGKNLGNRQYPLETLQIASPVQPSLTVYPNDPRTYDIRVRVKL